MLSLVVGRSGPDEIASTADILRSELAICGCVVSCSCSLLAWFPLCSVQLLLRDDQLPQYSTAIFSRLSTLEMWSDGHWSFSIPMRDSSSPPIR